MGCLMEFYEFFKQTVRLFSPSNLLYIGLCKIPSYFDQTGRCKKVTTTHYKLTYKYKLYRNVSIINV
jgi:hypothetical protein